MLNNEWKPRADRYLAINAWLKQRYSGKGVGRFPGWPGCVITWAGGHPTKYELLDRAFFNRYVLG